MSNNIKGGSKSSPQKNMGVQLCLGFFHDGKLIIKIDIHLITPLVGAYRLLLRVLKKTTVQELVIFC